MFRSWQRGVRFRSRASEVGAVVEFVYIRYLIVSILCARSGKMQICPPPSVCVGMCVCDYATWRIYENAHRARRTRYVFVILCSYINTAQ